METKQEWHSLADPEMIPWCAKLNSIPGIETLQSCSGHKTGDRSKCEGIYRYETNGQLWFVCDWITREIAFDLAEISTMEQVRMIFFPDGNAVWDLTFQGKNKGVLDESMTSIIKILSLAYELLHGA
jgi:hypothetical protein